MWERYVRIFFTWNTCLLNRSPHPFPFHLHNYFFTIHHSSIFHHSYNNSNNIGVSNHVCLVQKQKKVVSVILLLASAAASASSAVLQHIYGSSLPHRSMNTGGGPPEDINFCPFLRKYQVYTQQSFRRATLLIVR